MFITYNFRHLSFIIFDFLVLLIIIVICFTVVCFNNKHISMYLQAVMCLCYQTPASHFLVYLRLSALPHGSPSLPLAFFTLRSKAFRCGVQLIQFS